MIKILSHTKNPVSFMGQCSGQCWGSDTSNQEKNFKRGVDCIRSGHHRVMEYSDVTLEIDDYSARLIREIYTHIIGTSRLQESTRYVNCNDFKYYIPDSIRNNDSAISLYENIMDQISNTYNQLIALDIPKEDVANILPLGMNSKIVLKINVRALSHMFELRQCTRAYKEFRLFMKELKDTLSNLDTEWRWLCDNEFKIKCEKFRFCNETYSCGKFPKKQ